MANRLARESSPYLLLHAENPVDWYPWGEEAFERARREDKPIFLSIGYATCHWCHVMERESFSDPAVAREMNDAFVCIKVDREERPDVDLVYMTATQIIARAGGWPNSVFLTPDLKPFFAGTYFPPGDVAGRPGFPRVVQSLRETWLFRRAEVLQQAEAVARAMEQSLASARSAAPSLPERDLGGELLRELGERFDPEWGGFGPAPKFPSPSNLAFLLDRAGDEEARRMLLTTLDGMARGGIMDHVGGGFHRYSTDEAWLVPHFEKMLYDNASLAWLYAEASALAPADGFEQVARLTLDFVLQEMTGPHGAFFSAIDADTDGHEGVYYTWTAEELDQALPGAEGELFMGIYGVEGPPPFEGERYVLHLPISIREAASAGGMDEAELRRRIEPGRRSLIEARGRRPRPATDDKILADWNGLMIGAMARAGVRLGERCYVDAARRAASFVLESHVDGSRETLLHCWRQGQGRVDAQLDDYAFLAQGLLELHAATGDARWLDAAVGLAAQQEERLGDPRQGGYFSAGTDPRLPFRAKPAFDGALAAGNGVAALNLIELFGLTGEAVWADRAEATLRAFGEGMAQAPMAHVTLVRALERYRAIESRIRPRAGADVGVARTPAAGPSRAAEASALEAEAEAAVELRGTLESGPDDDWKPFRVEVEIRRGWHVNSNPAGPGLIPLSVSGVLGRIRALQYPPAHAAGGGTVPVLVGLVEVRGEIERVGGGAPAVEVTYQACDDARCLPPVSRMVRLR